VYVDTAMQSRTSFAKVVPCAGVPFTAAVPTASASRPRTLHPALFATAPLPILDIALSRVKTVSLLDENYALASLAAVEYEQVGVTTRAYDAAEGTAVDCERSWPQLARMATPATVRPARILFFICVAPCWFEERGREHLRCPAAAARVLLLRDQS